mmetsp:Transcript_16385/g.26181  ORF Transcript_16385/g.26181 Transcript_16385/m.26181 type:complete len:88 (-) Transcript_16385:8-271(-)
MLYGYFSIGSPSSSSSSFSISPSSPSPFSEDEKLVHEYLMKRVYKNKRIDLTIYRIRHISLNEMHMMLCIRFKFIVPFSPPQNIYII